MNFWFGRLFARFERLVLETSDARLGIIALGYTKRFDTNDKVNLKYTADLGSCRYIAFS